jgi:hypothetical protein
MNAKPTPRRCCRPELPAPPRADDALARGAALSLRRVLGRVGLGLDAKGLAHLDAEIS